MFMQNRDIFQYLKAKSGPIADFLPNVADLVPHIAQLDKLESFERGIFSIVVAVFLPNEMGEDKVFLTTLSYICMM